mmetsp:Transcript_121922/g.352105  ORF Transcript_121922/g.352105 Transcript_121922/m.352105 type:complete len:303 (+) Transcript_121922:85-993(+)
MRPLSMTFAAIASSCATNWYWLGQESRFRQGPAVVHVHECDATPKDCSCNCEAQAGPLIALKEAAAALDSLEAAGVEVGSREDAVDKVIEGLPKRNEVTERVDEATAMPGSVWLLVKDLAIFTAESVAAEIWPWADVMPTPALDGESGPGVLEKAAVNVATWPVWQQAHDSADWCWQHLCAGTTAVWRHIPPEVFAFAARGSQFAEELAAETKALALDAHAVAHKAVEAFLAAFLARYPQHGASLADSDPLAVLTLLVTTLIQGLVDVYFGTWLLVSLLRRICCCAGRKKGKVLKAALSGSV